MADEPTAFPKARRVPGRRPSVLEVGVRNGVRTALELARIIVPVYLGVSLLKQTPLLNLLAGWMAPLMRWFGLPGEAAMPLVLGNLLSMYSAVSAAEALRLSPRDMTILGTMIVISHNLPAEWAVLRQMGIRAGRITALRVLAGLAAGLFLGALWR